MKSLIPGKIWLQASSRKLQGMIDACFRLSAIDGIDEGV